MKKIISLIALTAVLTACSDDSLDYVPDSPDIIVEQPNIVVEQPNIVVEVPAVPVTIEQPIQEPQPVEPVEVTLQVPEVRGTVQLEQIFKQPAVGLPEPYILMTFSIWWESEADGFDIILDGDYHETITQKTWEYQTEHYGTKDDFLISDNLIEVRVRAWLSGSDVEVVSDPVTWVN